MYVSSSPYTVPSLPLDPAGDAVLVLDCDGVIAVSVAGVAAEKRLILECVARLNTIVRRTRPRVVVSSSWREVGTVPTLLGWFRAGGYQGPVNDVTPVHRKSDGFADPYVREGEIEAWLRAQPRMPRALAILDDIRIGGRLFPHLVQTTEATGLTDAHVERAVALLGGDR